MAESATYRGYPLIIDNADVLVICPVDGDVACFYSMARVRKWVRRKQLALEREEVAETSEPGDRPESAYEGGGPDPRPLQLVKVL